MQPVLLFFCSFVLLFFCSFGSLNIAVAQSDEETHGLPEWYEKSHQIQSTIPHTKYQGNRFLFEELEAPTANSVNREIKITCGREIAWVPWLEYRRETEDEYTDFKIGTTGAEHRRRLARKRYQSQVDGEQRYYQILGGSHSRAYDISCTATRINSSTDSNEEVIDTDFVEVLTWFAYERDNGRSWLLSTLVDADNDRHTIRAINNNSQRAVTKIKRLRHKDVTNTKLLTSGLLTVESASVSRRYNGPVSNGPNRGIDFTSFERVTKRNAEQEQGPVYVFTYNTYSDNDDADNAQVECRVTDPIQQRNSDEYASAVTSQDNGQTATLDITCRRIQ